MPISSILEKKQSGSLPHFNGRIELLPFTNTILIPKAT